MAAAGAGADAADRAAAAATPARRLAGGCISSRRGRRGRHGAGAAVVAGVDVAVAGVDVVGADAAVRALLDLRFAGGAAGARGGDASAAGL